MPTTLPVRIKSGHRSWKWVLTQARCSMYHFTTVLLLVAGCIPFVRSDDLGSPFLPAVHHEAVPAMEGKGSRAQIRGLLIERQSACVDPGYGVCRGTNHCCPIGGDCCSDGRCCASGKWCNGFGGCCPNNYNSCSGNHCCPKTWQCCSDGGCCWPGTYCVKDSSGNVGCCPNGQTCYGPIGGGGPPPPTTTPRTTTRPPTTSPRPPPTTTPPTTTRPSPISSSSSSRPTASPSGGAGVIPVPEPGSENEIITANDVSINFNGGEWNVGLSFCNTTQQSKKTSAGQHSITWSSTSDTNRLVFLDISANGARFDILINNEKQDLSNVNIANCTYIQLGMAPAGVTLTVTILIIGPVPLESRQVGGSDWSFEFNSFLVQKRIGSGTGTSSLTPTALSSAMKDTQMMNLFAFVPSVALIAALLGA
ncbi:hypothetical protein AMATHDRAFT_66531 [Amanita thiersii Skay4041]|uniref:Carbohydrate-binding module family 18 protein n=1 Tax=Amanita thiersii Skay4041 TaxID=703135 RepID=A0A2A9NJR1_9AGAR|nr:hypothetical protein AMATHDRAFT_66531 [Amanita thiersii Skay4041]